MKPLQSFFKLSLLTLCIIFSSNIHALKYLDDAEQLFNEGNYSSAVIQLKNYLKDFPQNPEARLLLGKSYLKMWDVQLAAKEIKRAYQLDPSDEEIILEYAHLLLLQNQYTKMKQVLNKKMLIEKNELQRQIYKADSLLAQEYQEDAKQSYSQLLSLGDNVQVYNGLANVAMLENDFIAASKWLKKSLKLKPEDSDALQISARIDIQKKNYSGALEIYNQLIKQQKNNLVLFLKRAVVKIQIDDLKGAEADVQTVIARIRNHPQANFMLAQIKLKEKKFKEAQIAAQDVLKVSPYHVESMGILGVAHFGQGNYNQADKYLTQYLSSNPDNINVQNILANVYLQEQGNGEQTILMLEGLDEAKKNNNAGILTTLGSAYLRTGEFDKAVKALMRANELIPNNVYIQKKLVEGQFKIGDITTAISSLEKIIDSESVNKKTYTLLISTYIKNKDYQKAEDKVKEIIDRKPEQLAPLYNLLADIENAKGSSQSAQAAYERAIQENDNYIPAYAGLAELAIAKGDFSLAKTYYAKIKQINPKDIKAYMVLARIAEKQNKPIEVEKQLRGALAQAKYSIETMEAIARLLSSWYIKQKEPEKILSLADELINEFPANTLALSFLANAQIANNKNEQAKDTLKTIINNNNLDTTHRLTLAELLAKEGGHEDEILSLIDTVISIRPDSPKPILMKTNFFIAQKKFNKAIDVANFAEMKFPELVFGYQLKGDIYRQQGKFDEAIVNFQKAYKVKPSSQLAIIISDLLSQQGRESEALELLQKALNNNNSDAIFHLKMASLYLKNQQYNSAIEQYLKVLEINPENVMVLNNLSWTYAQDKNPKALIVAKKAYEISPMSVTVLDTYGYILVSQGNMNDGISLLEKAVKMSPNDYAIQYHLAQGYYFSGDKEKALAILKPLINIEKAFSDKENVKMLFNKLQ